MDTSRVDGVKAPQHRGTPRTRLPLHLNLVVLFLFSHALQERDAILEILGVLLEARAELLGHH
jgi:hypothetical protein